MHMSFIYCFFSRYCYSRHAVIIPLSTDCRCEAMVQLSNDMQSRLMITAHHLCLLLILSVLERTSLHAARSGQQHREICSSAVKSALFVLIMSFTTRFRRSKARQLTALLTKCCNHVGMDALSVTIVTFFTSQPKSATTPLTTLLMMSAVFCSSTMPVLRMHV